jgi:predicted O-linked N-acetylglucosamine transferase (SPINDLY family)
MAGALLTAAGCPELITVDLASYEEKAVALATDAVVISEMKSRMGDVRTGGLLFDTPRFVSALERNLLAVLKNDLS